MFRFSSYKNYVQICLIVSEFSFPELHNVIQIFSDRETDPEKVYVSLIISVSEKSTRVDFDAVWKPLIPFFTPGAFKCRA